MPTEFPSTRRVDPTPRGNRVRVPARGGASDAHTAVYLLVVLTAGVYLPTPLYPGYQHAFGFGDLTMTMIYAAFALVSAPALLLFGPASDALGPRPVLRASIVLAGLGSACFALASGPGWLLVGRAAQGCALGAATGAATALIAGRYGGAPGARGSLVATMAFVAGTAAGPIAAGLLAQYAPAPRVLPFLAHLVLLAVGWWRVSAAPAPATAGVPRWRPTRPHVPASLRGRFATAATTGFLAWTVAGLFLAVVPAVLNRASPNITPAVTGGIVGAVLACSVLVQPLIARCGVYRAQLGGLAALLGSLAILALTGGGSVQATLIAAVAAGIGHGLAFGGAATAVDTAAPAANRAEITATLYLAFYLGSGIPAVAVGLLTLAWSLATAISWLSLATAALVPLAAVAVVVIFRPDPVARPLGRKHSRTVRTASA